jgi:hypothetical protein
MHFRSLPPTLTVAGAATVLAVAIAGCGGATATQKPTGGKPTSKPAATATPAASLTLAEASSPSYTVKVPMVPCTTLSQAAQSAWQPLIAGSSVGKCAPADYLQTDVPQNVTVVNKDSAITQSQANAYGEALVTTLAWLNYAAYDDAPALLNQIGQAYGANYPMYQWLEAGARVTSAPSGEMVFPEKIVLIPLTASQANLLLNKNATFALLTQYNQTQYSFTWTPPGQSGSFASTPQVFTGAIATNPVLGAYFQVSTYSNDCAIGPDVGMCQSYGVS